MVDCERNYSILMEPSEFSPAGPQCSRMADCRLPRGSGVLGQEAYAFPPKYNSDAVLDDPMLPQLMIDEPVLTGLRIAEYSRARSALRSRAVSLRQQQLKAEFTRLASVWREETCLSSRLDQILLHWAYRRIIGMRSDAVPLILQELTRKIDHWFWALMLITGENPGAQAEDMEGMAAAWIKWGEEKGYLNG